ALAVPVVGGNVSFYNEADEAIFPTPVIAMLGVLADVRCHATPGWKQGGDPVVLLGGGVPQLDGSEYLATVHGITAGRLRRPDRGVALARAPAGAAAPGAAPRGSGPGAGGRRRKPAGHRPRQWTARSVDR